MLKFKESQVALMTFNLKMCGNGVEQEQRY